MSTDEFPPQPPVASHLARLVTSPTRADAAALAAESTAGVSGPPQHPDEVLGRVDAAMKAIPEDEIADPAEYRKALAIFLAEADKALKKVAAGDTQLAPGEQFAVEAVIKTDGTRPSLLIRNDRVDEDHPLAGAWRDTLINRVEMIRKASQSIGRIEPAAPTIRNYFGTGWVVKHVDVDRALVLTNNHVLECMKQRLPAGSLVEQNGRFIATPGRAFIDFAAESGSLAQRRFAIEAIAPTPVPGQYFHVFDAAVMTIVKTADSPSLPAPISVVGDLDGPLGNLSSYCLIGYPGPPEQQAGVHEGVDWNWVTTTLFGGRFGVKRLAPAITHRKLGTISGDVRPWVFGHDGTTLGGSSGSPALAWLDGVKAFGLHFAGINVASNFGHALGACRDQLTALSVPLVG